MSLSQSLLSRRRRLIPLACCLIWLVSTLQAQIGLPVDVQLNASASQAGEFGAVAMAANGDYTVVWFERGSLYQVLGRQYDSTGALRTATFRVDTTSDGDIINIANFPQVAANAAGDFVVAWSATDVTQLTTVAMVRRFAADGTPQGAPIQAFAAPAGFQGGLDLDMADDGSFVVAASFIDLSTLSQSLIAQRFAADGSPRGGQINVAGAAGESNGQLDISVDANGDFAIAWIRGFGTSAFGGEGDFELRVNLYDSAGNLTAEHIVHEERADEGLAEALRGARVAKVAGHGWAAMTNKSFAGGTNSQTNLLLRYYPEQGEPTLITAVNPTTPDAEFPPYTVMNFAGFDLAIGPTGRIGVVFGGQKAGQQYIDFVEFNQQLEPVSKRIREANTRPRFRPLTVDGELPNSFDLNPSLSSAVDGLWAFAFHRQEISIAVPSLESGLVRVQAGGGGQTWGPYPIEANGLVDTEEWLGWLDVSAAPWVWSYSYTNWFYFEASTMNTGSGWLYAQAGSAAAASTDPKWGRFSIVDGTNVNTENWLGWLDVATAPWIWSYSTKSYFFIPESTAEAGVGWIFML